MAFNGDIIGHLVNHNFFPEIQRNANMRPMGNSNVVCLLHAKTVYCIVITARTCSERQVIDLWYILKLPTRYGSVVFTLNQLPVTMKS